MLTIEKLKETLTALKPDQTFDLGYDDFDRLFPPGVPDQSAMKKFGLWMEELRCDLENREAERIIRLTKRQPKP